MICSTPLAPSFTGTPTNRSWMPYSPCRNTEHGMIFFWSLRIASTISAADAPGAYQALVPTSLVISAPPLAVRVQIASSFSCDSCPIFTSSVSGMPATVDSRGSGTIVSPWPPSTKR